MTTSSYSGIWQTALTELPARTWPLYHQYVSTAACDSFFCGLLQHSYLLTSIHNFSPSDFVWNQRSQGKFLLPNQHSVVFKPQIWNKYCFMRCKFVSFPSYMHVRNFMIVQCKHFQYFLQYIRKILMKYLFNLEG